MEKPSRRSERGSGKSSRRERESDYYDAVHASLSQDEWLGAYLMRRMRTSRRTFQRSVLHFFGSVLVLVEIPILWFRHNWRIATLTTLGMGIFVAGVYFAKDYIQPARKRAPVAHLTGLASADAAERLDARPWDEVDSDDQEVSADDFNAAAIETASDRSTAIGGRNASAPDSRPTEPSPTSRIGELNGAPSSPVASVAPPPVSSALRNELGQSFPRPIDPPAAFPSNKVLWEDLLIEIQGQTDAAAYNEAIATLQNAVHREPNFQTESSRLLLTALYLGAKQYPRAGQLLSHQKVADPHSDLWSLLLTCWLLHAPADSRTEVSNRLSSLAGLQPENYRGYHRVLTWIETRNGDASLAAEPLPEDEATYCDDLFVSLACRFAGQSDLARTRLQAAELKLNDALDQRNLRNRATAIPAEIGERILRKAMVAYGSSL
ncbi:hypothetical protein [Aureliella helgolandensis]|uniref:Tetratricopeptide repeat protein n=1 Tax=Aureliella helgolandensis TaxID=2527968 RepID=A0A518G8X8_9BACT|nr:hypothetical protein [Aureliella helgolandensis]QDV25019.1 hypothetical protein Q31a_33410 [Aureliella helgolandensis]